MNVTDAIKRRKTIRAFLPEPVDDATIRELLELSARAPSGGNVQPQRIYVLNGDSMTRFREHIADKRPGKPAYPVYPENLWEPHRTTRFELGELMYEKLGIPRDDRPARLRQLAKNYTFFEAPAAIFCCVDRRMGSAQWSDLGMFLQTFMLAAQEAGLDTCPQEAWAPWDEVVREFVGAPDEELVFCAIGIGKADWDAPVNSLESPRLPLDQWAHWV